MLPNATDVRSLLVGRPSRAIPAVVAAALATIASARWVAATNAYLEIEQALPTYDGSLGAAFYLFGGALVGLAVASAAVDAGLVPTLLLAGGPVAGWAVNHATAPIELHYSATFPLEMAFLYGGLFGGLGFLLGAGLRAVAPPRRETPLPV
ncbi:hypothetical protein [Halomicrobium urmianum]|uniref:hypothetical protein n=1 Tax=Halomicrobium urmianum TaxID=1586233 RepID=UPI001CD98EDD|nr:hypothetical protein [Halomicrobium urmianum]